MRMLRSAPLLSLVLVAGTSCADGAAPPTEAAAADALALGAPDTPTVVDPPAPHLPARPLMPLECNDASAIAPGFSYGRLLTAEEYENTVLDLLAVDATGLTEFPDENQALGFGNGVAHKASALLVELYMKAAEGVVTRSLTEGALSADPCVAGDVCAMGERIDHWGERLFRRPLRDDERAIFVALSKSDVPQNEGERVALVVEAMLQSPQFLYRFEGSNDAEDGESVPLDGYSLASRLSYLIFDGPPDDELRDAAANGALETEDGLVAQARRMLADPRAKRMLRDFHTQWLHLDGANLAVKDETMFPDYEPDMRAAWRESVLHFITDAVYPADDSMRTLFSGETFYVDGTLAPLYGGVDTNASFQPMASAVHGGLLTQPGLMALLANPDQGSPIRRGVFVREKVLCEPLPPPPNDQAIVPPDPDPNATTRERFAEHTESEDCAGCHILIDPLGFGFEHFDALGRYRTSENGLPIDASGEVFYPTMNEASLLGPFDGAAELSERLGASLQVRQCIATQWFRYAFGRAETEADACNLAPGVNELNTRGDLKAFIIELVKSSAFRYREGGE